MLDKARVGIDFLESFRIEDGMVVVDGVRASASKTTGVHACNLGDLFVQHPEGKETGQKKCTPRCCKKTV
jgi:hypothetical protein